MHFKLKLTALFAAAITVGCGGSDSDSDAPVVPTVPYAVAVEAGVATGSTYNPGDTEPGCLDGAAVGAKLHPSYGALTRTADGQLLLPELGSCDGYNRIRAVAPSGNTIKTLAIGANLSVDQKEPLTTFLTPVSIATAPSGEIFIADSDVFTGQMPSALREVPGRGAGIWKLDAAGNVSPLAGVTLPSVGQISTGADGQGAAASFGFLGTMCYGSDGLLYFTDNSQLRTVSTGGLVSTSTSAGAKQQAVLACGFNGSVLVRRWFQNSADDDYYDPIGRKTIAKASAVGQDFQALVYWGPSNPTVVIQASGTSPTLALLSLTDGSTATIAKIGGPTDLSASPPTIDGAVRAGTAISNTDFALLTNRAVLKFARSK